MRTYIPPTDCGAARNSIEALYRGLIYNFTSIGWNRYFSTHKIRAWGITEALASGMDQASVMRIAGHASPQTMRHYVRTARIQKDIGEKFDSVFN